MAAPVQNQFWKQRSKHGRDVLFATADLLWDSACEYFQYCDDNPILTVEFNGKDAVECIVPKMRAYTLSGLCLYLDCGTNYFRQFKESELGKTKDFSFIISRIEETCYTQKFEGAAAGVLNANIISRDLGLADKQINENTHTVSDDMLRSIADKLNA